MKTIESLFLKLTPYELIQNISIPLRNSASLSSVLSISWILLSLGINRRVTKAMLLEKSEISYTLSELNSVKTQYISSVPSIFHSAMAPVPRLTEKNESFMC